MQVEQYCFRAPYVTALLRHGLHVAEAQVHIGSGDVAWTLGERGGTPNLFFEYSPKPAPPPHA